MGVPGGRAECLTPLGARRQWEPLDSPLWQATPRGFRRPADGDAVEVSVLPRSRPFTPLLGSDPASRPQTPGGVSRPRTAGSAAGGVEAARAAGDAARAAADAALAAARLFCVDEEEEDPVVDQNREEDLPSWRPLATVDAKQADETKSGRDVTRGSVGSAWGPNPRPVKSQDKASDMKVQDFLSSLHTSQQDFKDLDSLLMGLSVGKKEPRCKRQDLPGLLPASCGVHAEPAEPAPEPPVERHVPSMSSRPRSPSRTNVPETGVEKVPHDEVDPTNELTTRASGLPLALQASSVENFLEGLSRARSAFDHIQAWTPRKLEPSEAVKPPMSRNELGRKDEAVMDAKQSATKSAPEGDDAMRPWQSPISGRTSLRRIRSEDSATSCETDGSASKDRQLVPQKLVAQSSPCMESKPSLPAKMKTHSLEAQSLEERQKLQRPPRPGKVQAPKEPPTMGNLAAMAAFAGRNLVETDKTGLCVPGKLHDRVRKLGSETGSSQGSEDWQRSRASHGCADEPDDIIRLPALSKAGKVTKVPSLQDVYRKKEAFKPPRDCRETDRDAVKISPPVSKPGSARSSKSALEASPKCSLLPSLPNSSRSMRGAAAPISSSIRRSRSAADVRASGGGMTSPRRPRSDRGGRDDIRRLRQASGASQLISSHSSGALC